MQYKKRIEKLSGQENYKEKKSDENKAFERAMTQLYKKYTMYKLWLKISLYAYKIFFQLSI